MYFIKALRVITYTTIINSAALLFMIRVCCAYTCPGKTCELGMADCQVRCETYIETIYRAATIPADGTWNSGVTIGDILILENCNGDTTRTDEHVVSMTYEESLAHSCSGALTSSIGADLGTDAVAKLGLQYATTMTNGWQKTDTYSLTQELRATLTAPAHSRVSHCWTMDFEDGSFTKSGSMEWDCLVREYCWGEYFPGHGSCQSTTSYACGYNKANGGVIHSEYDTPACNE
ncbi:MAG: hypothetical protein PHT33_02910 [bacterium]|nr:hypothetical protein [bacterium]